MIKSNLICTTKLSNGSTTIDLTKLTEDYEIENMKKCKTLVCCDKISNGKDIYTLEDIKNKTKILVEYVRVHFDNMYFYHYDKPDEEIRDTVTLQFVLRNNFEYPPLINNDYFVLSVRPAINAMLTIGFDTPGGDLIPGKDTNSTFYKGDIGVAYVNGRFKSPIPEEDCNGCIRQLDFLDKEKKVVFQLQSDKLFCCGPGNNTKQFLMNITNLPLKFGSTNVNPEAISTEVND